MRWNSERTGFVWAKMGDLEADEARRLASPGRWTVPRCYSLVGTLGSISFVNRIQCAGRKLAYVIHRVPWLRLQSSKPRPRSDWESEDNDGLDGGPEAGALFDSRCSRQFSLLLDHLHFNIPRIRFSIGTFTLCPLNHHPLPPPTPSFAPSNINRPSIQSDRRNPTVVWLPLLSCLSSLHLFFSYYMLVIHFHAFPPSPIGSCPKTRD